MRKIITCLTLMLALTAAAERGSKMSAFLQRYAASHQQAATRAAESGAQPCIMAFVKTAPGIGGQLLGKYGSTVLTSSGDIYIAVIPASQLQALAADEAVVRIEANEVHKPVMDTTHIVTGADKVQAEQYQKWGLQQAYDGKEHLMWVSDGTSMATPVVAGVIALWLQAAPTLTPQRIKEVISRTGTRLDASLDYPNNKYGYGQIDAYKGLLDILGLTAIEGLSQREPEGVTFRRQGGLLYADGVAEGTPVTIYNLQGAIVSRQTVSGGLLSIAGLARGVYAVQIGGLGSTLIRK